MSDHSISLDLLHQFKKNGHNVFAVCGIERKDDRQTTLSEEDGITVLRVKIGNNKKAGLIEKGLTTLFLPRYYINAIKEYFPEVRFDLVVYPTPPVTHVDTVRYIKKRDNARSYLLLKDIFPQNAVDIGIMSKSGLKGVIYRYFRNKEKKLYAVSDYIGCMSKANAEYLLNNNPELRNKEVEICPNSIEVFDQRIGENERIFVRKKYELPLDKKIFIYGGNLGKPQDVPFIIECLKSQKDKADRFFVIVGDGSEYRLIEDYVNTENQNNVKLLKKLDKQEYDKLVSCCDAGMIFLDHRFTIPNFPSRLLGYMQAGIPVISCTDSNTDIGRVITENQIGWACISDCVDNFDDCVEKAMAEVDTITGETVFECLKKLYSVEDSYKTIIHHFED